MDLSKRYVDVVNSHITAVDILYMTKQHPEWAANRIQVGERALAMLSPEQRRAAESEESAQTAPNSAMVPCPHFENERTCPIQFNAICGLNPCLIQRAQHQ